MAGFGRFLGAGTGALGKVESNSLLGKAIGMRVFEYL
jgi:hypothetical protein